MVTTLGSCPEIGAEGLPYAPLVTALRRLHRSLGPELEAAAAGMEGHLARLFPDFGEPDGGPNDEHGRAHLFEHTARLFERLGADRTLVLAVEDLHWSDRSTRELLAYLLRTLHRSRVLIVATYRTDDLHRRHPLRPFLVELERLRTVQRVELERFVRGEVAEQLAYILGTAAPDRELVDRIHRRSEGNPFFVEELATSFQSGCSAGLTDSLRDILLVRVEALPEDTQRVVRIAAEGGSYVEHALLAAVLDDGEEALIEALRTAVGANILRPDTDGDGYRFRHALVREAVSDDLLPGERHRINRRYATALEEQPALVGPDVGQARLANYWYHAHDSARALPSALDAARAARRRNAFAEQLRMLERALELWDQVSAEVLQNTLRPYDWAETYPRAAAPPAPTTTPASSCSSSTCWPRRWSLPAAAGTATAASASPSGPCTWWTKSKPGPRRLVPDVPLPDARPPQPARPRRGARVRPCGWSRACRRPRCRPRCWPWTRPPGCSATPPRSTSSWPSGRWRSPGRSAPPTSSSTP